MPEYYIKPEGAAEAQGPFTANDLKTMAAEGKIDPHTPHFYDDLVGWQPLLDNQPLYSAIFVESKSKLTLRQASAPVVAPKKGSARLGAPLVLL